MDPVLIHGDFHPQQILLDEERERSTLIDWDETRVGDPREDVGNLLAHLHLLELEERLSDAEADRLRSLFLGETGSPPDISPFVALHLVKLAFVPLRDLRSDWRDAIRRLLERATTILSCLEATK